MQQYPPLNSDDSVVPGENEQARPHFWIYRFIILVLLLIAALSLIPFYPSDIDYYAGGVNGVSYPHNHIGAVGAHFGWFCLTTLGLGTYPLLFASILCCVRRLVWRKKLLPRKWDYLLAIPLFGLGMSLLFAIWPTSFEGLTTCLNIKGLPGGVLGQLFCEPGQGIIHRLLSTLGCIVISLAIIILTASVVWKYDWKELWMDWWSDRLEKRRAAEEDLAKRLQEEEELARQQAEMAPQAPASPPGQPTPEQGQSTTPPQSWAQQQEPASMPSQPPQAIPQQPAVSSQNWQPVPPPPIPQQEVFTTQASLPQPDAEAGFRTRRGQASIDAARQAAEAIYGSGQPFPPRNSYEPVAQQPAMKQPELPQPAQPSQTQPQQSAWQQPAQAMWQQPAQQPQQSAQAMWQQPAQQPQQSAQAMWQQPAQPQPTQPAWQHIPQAMQSAPQQAGDMDPYSLPQPMAFFQPLQGNKQELDSAKEISESREILQRTLDEFGLDAEVINAVPGPQVTLYEIQMGSGIPLSRLGGIQSNLSMALKASRPIRMLLPIPGKACAGIEVPNRVRKTVCAHELFSSETWLKTKMRIPLMLGKNINGGVCMLDLKKAPHLLVAGATGSGKSVCMNLMIQSMLLRFSPDCLKLILFDPKFLEFAPYSKLPHLISPIINEAEQVAVVLNWACREMDKRYKQLAAVGVKQLDEFNERPNPTVQVLDSDGDVVPASLPYIVIIIDELADIMARAKKEVDVALARLAGKARAAGIHMIVATQRPSSDVITGVIKSNFPQRIALQVTDQVNSRVILDSKGAENLLGQGDMLYSTGAADSERIQCGWVTNEEIAAIANACATQSEQNFDESLMRALESRDAEGDGGDGDMDGVSDIDEYVGEDADPMDLLVRKALAVLERTKRPTISVMQRQLRIGYNKSADLMDELETRGYVGPQPISGFREIYWDNFPGHGGAATSDAPVETPSEYPVSPDAPPDEN